MTHDEYDKGEVGTVHTDSIQALHPGDKLTIRAAAADLPHNIQFGTARGTVLIITADGRLERGEGFATDDEASVAFFEVMSSCFYTWISDLRQRAEKAEREVRYINFWRIDGPIPTLAAFSKLGGRLMRFAADNRLTFDVSVAGWRMRVGQDRLDTEYHYEAIDIAPGLAMRGMLAEDLGLGP